MLLRISPLDIPLTFISENGKIRVVVIIVKPGGGHEENLLPAITSLYEVSVIRSFSEGVLL